MCNEQLMKPMLDAEKWAKLFSGKSYQEAFSLFTQEYSSKFAEALEKMSSKDVAETLIGAVTEILRKEPVWRRKKKQWNIRVMLTFYLTPMLLEMQSEETVELAKSLRATWQLRWPKQTYELANETMILKSFRRKILAFDIGPVYAEENAPQQDRGFLSNVLHRK